MKTNLLKILSVFFALSLFALASCENPDPDVQSAEDDARGSYIMADAFAIGNNEAGGGGKAFLENCYTVDRQHQDTVIIDFTGCSNKSGKIIVAFTVPNPDRPRVVNIVITFENYFVDDIAVDGTITTSSTFIENLGIPEINVVAEGMSATFSDQKEITWSSNKTFTMTEGFGDGDIINNVIEMSGTASGINRKGESYSSVYNTVRDERDCPEGYPVSGTVTIESDKGTSVIDYGEGKCDKIITVTNNGITITVTLD